MVMASLVSLLLAGPGHAGASSDGDLHELALFDIGADRMILPVDRFGAEASVHIPADAKIESAAVTARAVHRQSAERFPTGRAPESLAGGDLDGDGDVDLCAVSPFSDELYIMGNDGGGAMTHVGSYPTGSSPSDVDIGDADGDGDMDLAVATEYDDRVTLYLNKGDGTFPETVKVPVGGHPMSVMFADIDGDKAMDLLTTSRNNDAVGVNLRLPAIGTEPSFSPVYEYPAGDDPRSAVLGDFNGDGVTDVATCNAGGDDIAILPGDGVIGFEAPIFYTTDDHPVDIAALDMDGDGDPDLVTANEGGKNVSYLRNGGPSYGFIETLVPVELGLPRAPMAIQAGDLDGDGRTDVVAMARSEDSVVAFMNDGWGGIGRRHSFCAGYEPSGLVLADMDGDGDLDVAVSNRGVDSISVVRNYGRGLFAAYSHFGTGASPRGVVADDFDGDGDPDLAVANYYSGTVTMLLNDGKGRFIPGDAPKIGLEPQGIVTADFDGDGDLDIATADEARFEVIMLFNRGDGSFSPDRPHHQIGGYPFSLFTDDLDGDGDPDIGTANHGQNSTSILLNDGAGGFAPYFTVDLGDHKPFGTRTADMDGDGRLDIVTANVGDDQFPESTISVMLRKPTGGLEGERSFTGPYDYDVGLAPMDIVLADLDGDSDTDVLSVNNGDSTLTYLVNDGFGKLTEKRVLPVGLSPSSAEAVDIDGDGDLDIVSINNEGNSFTRYYNDGSGGFGEPLEVSAGFQPFRAAVADLNGDGRTDIAVTNVGKYAVSTHYFEDIAGGVEYRVGRQEARALDNSALLGPGIELDIAGDLAGAMEDAVPFKWTADQRPEWADGLPSAQVERWVKVPLNLTSRTSGLVELRDLEITYELDAGSGDGEGAGEEGVDMPLASLYITAGVGGVLVAGVVHVLTGRWRVNGGGAPDDVTPEDSGPRAPRYGRGP